MNYEKANIQRREYKVLNRQRSFNVQSFDVTSLRPKPHRSRQSYVVVLVIQLCLTLCDPMDGSMPGFPVHHQLLELAQTHVHRVSDAIHPAIHLLSSPSPSAFNVSQHQGLFQ